MQLLFNSKDSKICQEQSKITFSSKSRISDLNNRIRLLVVQMDILLQCNVVSECRLRSLPPSLGKTQIYHISNNSLLCCFLQWNKQYSFNLAIGRDYIIKQTILVCSSKKSFQFPAPLDRQANCPINAGAFLVCLKLWK